jgi:hypothetical protein
LPTFLNRRVVQYLELARKAVHASWAAQPLAEQTLEARLGSLPAREPLTCARWTTPLAGRIDAHAGAGSVGSMIVLDAAGAPHGILTRHDILGRVTLPQRSAQHGHRRGHERTLAGADRGPHPAGCGVGDVTTWHPASGGDRSRAGW